MYAPTICNIQGLESEKLYRHMLTKLGTTSATAPRFPNTAVHLQKDIRDLVESRVYLSLKALVTFLFSSIGSVLIWATSAYEMHMTYSAHVAARMVMLTIFNIVNYFIVTMVAVLVVSFLDKGNQSLWCALPQAASTQQLVFGNECKGWQANLLQHCMLMHMHHIGRRGLARCCLQAPCIACSAPQVVQCFGLRPAKHKQEHLSEARAIFFPCIDISATTCLTQRLRG
jgi:hypothetical protein